jgi:ribosomal-protein-alanine N-acetyltransferase
VTDRHAMMGFVGRMRGWPVTLTETGLLAASVTLRPIRVKDASAWRDARVRNASWLRPWEPTNPETPLYRTTLGPYVAMARTMRREARQGLTLPWVVTYGGKFAGQLTVGGIVWGSARSAQVGYWVDEAFAGQGVIPPPWPWPWTTASSASACIASRPPSGPRTPPAAASSRN